MAKDLLDLPSEVRLIIFHHLFTGLKIKYIPRLGLESTDYSRTDYGMTTIYEPTQLPEINISVLLVSRTIHQESYSLLLKTARLNITAAIDDWYGSVMIESLRYKAMPLAKHVYLDMSSMVHNKWIDKVLDLLPSLELLDFNLSSESGYGAAKSLSPQDFSPSGSPSASLLTYIQDDCERLVGISPDGGIFNEEERVKSLLHAWNGRARQFDLVLHSTVDMIFDDDDDDDDEMMHMTTWVRQPRTQR